MTVSRHLIRLATLALFFPVLGCSSGAAPAKMSPKFRAAIERADQAVHEDLRAQAEGGQAAYDAAVSAARAALREASAEAHSPMEENAYLVLLNCFAKDRQRYQMARMQREGMPFEYGADQIAGFTKTHEQCSAEFRRWTSTPAPVAGSGTNDSCLVEARKVKLFLTAQ